MSLAQIGMVAEGMANSLMLNEIKRLEDSVRAGGNAYFTGALQTLQAHTAQVYADRALASAGSGSIPLPLSLIFYVTPAVFALATMPGMIEDPVLRTVAIFLQDQLGNLCHIVSLVSSVALVYFGQTIFGATSIAVLAIGFLDRQKILPEGVRQLVHAYSPPLLFFTGVFYGDLISKIFSSIDAISYVIGVYFEWRDAQVQIPPVPPSQLHLQDFLLNQPALELNRDYVLWPTHALRVPDINLRNFIDTFDAIPWSLNNLFAMRRKLASDQRFAMRCGDPAAMTDRELVRIAREQLVLCVDAVINRRIAAGEPRRYERLVEYLKVIAHSLPREAEVSRIDTLMTLAIEAGEYCGPGIYDVAEEEYAARVGANEFFTNRVKILTCLQTERNRVMQGLYVQATALHQRPAVLGEESFVTNYGRILDWQDRHNIHLFLNLFGSELGLRKAGADNDEMAIADPLIKLIISHYFGEEIKGLFWRAHQTANAIQAVSEAIGTSVLPRETIDNWWQEWIERQEIPDAAKEELRNEFNDPMNPRRLYGENLEANGRVQERFVRAMLLDMGVLRIRG
ncbi:MAG: hypothetical protein ACHQT8_06870 [Chlamydiales bacterium]